jgi:hypothetical protein
MKSPNFYAHRIHNRQRDTERAIESDGEMDEGERNTTEIVDDHFTLACRRRIFAIALA